MGLGELDCIGRHLSNCRQLLRLKKRPRCHDALNDGRLALKVSALHFLNIFLLFVALFPIQTSFQEFQGFFDLFLKQQLVDLAFLLSHNLNVFDPQQVLALR